MKAFYFLILLVVFSASHGQTTLPVCKGDDATQWNHCLGAWTDPSGHEYVGNWKDGKQHGYHTVTFTTGDTYVGEFKEGQRAGQGIFTFSSGNKYIGQFKDDSANGLGTYYYLSDTELKGNKYVGEFRDWKMNGRGTYTWKHGDKYVGEFKDDGANGLGIYTFRDGRVWLAEWSNWRTEGRCILYKSNGSILDSGICKDDKVVKSQYIDPNFFSRITKINAPLVVSDIERQASEQKARQAELDDQRLTVQRRRLDEDKRQREQAKQASRISISATATQPDANGVVTLNIQTNTDTSSLKINGEELGGKDDGNYVVKKVARVGQETKFTLVGVDVNGYTDTKTITVSRTVTETRVTYPSLNPESIKRQPERDAVAVIIGISNYKNLPKAEFAKDDAQVFFDYAIRALGVRPGNIKLLMDEQADAEEIYTTFKTWLPARVKSTTDVYVFYSGHGLPTKDGSGLYWLPQRANRDVISKTAILLQDINSDIQAAKPKSVTIFMDACYSGLARGGETLVASARPIALKSQPTTFPSNFTVITASQADQISSSSPDLQHGIFSYYLMRGMEGEADLNTDGKITLDELQAYLSENVGRHARTMDRQQEPQVVGDGSKVLVGK